MPFLLSIMKTRQDISIFKRKLNLQRLHNLGHIENGNSEYFLSLKVGRFYSVSSL